MDLERFNQLPADEARAALQACLDVPRWVEEVMAGRLYDGPEALHKQAAASAQLLSDDELATALAQHPRIGERPAADGSAAAFSEAEQSGVSDDDDIAGQLAAANLAYERRFGHVFLIRAAGRSGPQILAELRRRTGNDPEAERAETVAALRDIALLRLARVVVPA